MDTYIKMARYFSGNRNYICKERMGGGHSWESFLLPVCKGKEMQWSWGCNYTTMPSSQHCQSCSVRLNNLLTTIKISKCSHIFFWKTYVVGLFFHESFLKFYLFYSWCRSRFLGWKPLLAPPHIGVGKECSPAGVLHRNKVLIIIKALANFIWLTFFKNT